MTLVVGATGLLGTEICRRLNAAGKSFRAMVRKTSDPAKKDTLKQFGAELVEADLKDRASLDRACQGVRAVITTPTAIGSKQEGDTFQTVDLDGQKALIDAASAAKVEHHVFVSVSGNLGKHGGNPLIDAKRAVENHLRQSGLSHTILRPTFFMEIWLSPHLGFDFGNAKATIYGSGKNKISYISLHNVADFAVAALSNPAARDAVIELGGPDTLSPLEVVRMFEEVSGRRFETQFVPGEQLQARKTAATNPVEQTFADLMLSAAHHDPIDMSGTFTKFQVRPKSVREYAEIVTSDKAGHYDRQ
jgi:Predicted nucleoside-diphosphate-sugar epimerases